MSLLLIGWHLGQLHAYEKVAVFGLAIFPFVVLGLLQWVRGKQVDESAEVVASEPGTAESLGEVETKAEAAAKAEVEAAAKLEAGDAAQPPAR